MVEVVMRHNSVLSFVCAVLLALTGPVSAAQGSLDFDSRGIQVPEIVKQARESSENAPELEVTAAELESARILAESGDIQRRIVVFNKGVPRTRMMGIMSTAGGTVTKDLWLINAVAVAAPKTSMQRMEIGLSAYSEVKRIDQDFVQNWLVGMPAVPVAAGAAAGLPGLLPMADPGSSQSVPWGIHRVNAQKAWEITRGAGVKVAVVDTGIDFDHADLNVAGGFNTIDPNVSFKDDNGHGTHVSGTIAAVDNGDGVVGVAPDVTLYGVKVLSASGGGTFADVIEGIQWTVENNMDVANFSLGASVGNDSLAEAVKAARDAGVAVIAAAGNSGRSVGYPAAYPEVLAVAASSEQDQVAYFSSRGPEVDVIAPGVSIYSTYMGGGYRSLSGTSMACPHMAGLAALAIAATGVHGIDAVRAALTAAATPFPDVPDTQQGAGMVDAFKLVGGE